MQPRLNDRPSGPQPDEKDFRNSRFSATAPSGVRRHISRRFLPCSRRALRQRSAGNNRLFGAANGNNRLRATTGKNRLSVAAPEKPGSTSGSAAAPGTASPAQRPLNARMNDRLSARPAPSCPPVHRLETPKTAREQPGAHAVPAKSRNVLHLFLI